MRLASGVSDQYIYFVAVDATDLKTRETGLSSFTVYRSRNGAAAAAYTTPTINETDVTNMPGVYELLVDEDVTIDAGDETQEICLHITHAGMAPVTRVIELYRPKITAGITLAATGTALDVVTTATTATNVTTVNGLAANVITATSIAADAITAAKIATGAIDADAIATDAVTEIQAGLATQTSVDAIATQATDILSLVESIAITGAASYTASASSTLTTGALSSGTYESTATADAVYHTHTDTAGALELMYEYTLGAAEVGVEVLFRGRLNGANDSVAVQAYDWIGADWETLWTQSGVAGSVDTNRAEPLLAKHTGTGANDGNVRIRFYAASGLTSATLYVDQLLVAKAETLTDDIAAILADTNELQTDWANGGRLDLILDARSSQASVDTVDTVVDAIKIKTDSLSFTVSGQVDSNVQYVNDVLVNGTGAPGSEWGS